MNEKTRRLAWRWVTANRWHTLVSGVAALLAIFGLLSAAGVVGIQLSPGPLGALAMQHSFDYGIYRPVGTPVRLGGSNLYNLTGAPMTVVGIAPSNRPPGVQLTAVILPVSPYTEGIKVRPTGRDRLRLPLVIPPGSRNQYVAGLEMRLTRAEDVVVWGLDITYWWRGALYHDYLPSARVDCVRPGKACTAMETAFAPLTWPAPSPVPDVYWIKPVNHHP